MQSPETPEQRLATLRFRKAFAAACATIALSGSGAFSAAASAADDDPQPAPAAVSAAVVVLERTEIKLTLDEDMRSGDVKENAEVPFVVEKDVTDDKGRLLIRAGTPAYGKVTKSKHHGAFGAPGKLEFTCDYVQTPGGTKVPLRQSSLASYGRDNRTATLATAILITPVALFIHGRDVTAKKGTEYVMYVDKTTTLGAAAATGTPAAAASVPGKSVYMTKDGKAYVGALQSFDGTTYTVSTDSGTVNIDASNLKSVTPVQ